VLYLATLPDALFLQAVYSESLYLALALAAFALAEARRWPLAAVAAGLALLTRSSGIAVVAGVAVLAWPRPKALAWVGGAAVALFALFPLTLLVQAHNAWAFLHSQSEWDRRLSPAGPFGGIWDALTGLASTPKGSSPHHALAVDLESLAFLVCFSHSCLPCGSGLAGVRGVRNAFAPPPALVSCRIVPAPLAAPLRTRGLSRSSSSLASLGRHARAHALIISLSALLLGIALAEW